MQSKFKQIHFQLILKTGSKRRSSYFYRINVRKLHFSNNNMSNVSY